jgi:hypothetical protein
MYIMKLLIVNQKFDGYPYSNSPELPYRIPNNQFSNFNWIIKTTTEIPRLRPHLLVQEFGELPNVILIWMNLKYIQRNIYFFKTVSKHKAKYNVKTCWYFDDVHNNVINRRSAIQHIDVILNSYEYYLHNYYSGVLKHTYWFPHSVNEILLNKISFNANPVNKLLLSGSVSENVYPARYKVSKILEYDDRIVRLSHPGYNIANPKHDLCGHNYYKYMNNFLACFTCCAFQNRPYVVAKFFEIIACGSCLIAYDTPVKEQLKKLGFIDGVNYIGCEDNYESIKEKIDFVLNPQNRALVNEIRHAGYCLSSERHFMIDRVEEFCEYIEKL